MNTNKLIPAFPTWIQDDSMAQGMSLRDYFAAAAMQGYLTQNNIHNWAQIASDSYSIADVMMEARNAA
jgi:hypothetical protein